MPGLEGTTLGHYRLLGRLGHGGMSEVYLAHDEHMDRDVAVKIVNSSHADYIERFRREVSAIGQLNHKHILPAYDYGEEEMWHYLVMPYMAHGTLRELLAKNDMSLEEAAEILDQVADALQSAHDNGIIHRDIKPSNILMRTNHYAYLADFGLAKALEGGGELTQTGTLLGTPEYMAPELADGPATTSSDVYALGILLYQMVSGRVPFVAETPIAVYWKQLRDQPVPPSELNPDISPAIDQVVIRALDKDPRNRYQTATELAHAYRQALETSIPEMPPLYE
ncbi:MAG: protein kinase, partial [Chloroflexota bacterium]|nr:protein kinase [Chloroflexota bacterium]